MYRNFTFEQYYTNEVMLARRNMALKSEFVQGEILTMPGTSSQHSKLTFNLGYELRRCFEQSDRSCDVLMQELMFYIPTCNLAAYPDLMLACETPDYLPGKENYVLLNPTVVAEVLSPPTADYDRLKKRPCYLSVPSVEAVLLLSQDEPRLEIYRKDKSAPDVYTEGRADLLGCTLDIERLYFNVL